MNKIFSAAMTVIVIGAIGLSNPAALAETSPSFETNLIISDTNEVSVVDSFGRPIDALATNQDSALYSIDGISVALSEQTNAFGDTAAALVSNETSELIWDFTEPSEVEISRDGNSLGKFSPKGNLEIQTNEGAKTFTITQESPVHESNGLVTVQTMGLSAAAPVQLTVAAEPSVLLAATTLRTNLNFRYQTFIRDQYVLVPIVGCTVQEQNPVTGNFNYFGGNNRGFAAGSSNNKTLLNINIDWVANTVSMSKKVYPTVVYEHTSYYTYTPVATKTASSADITLGAAMYGSTVYMHFVHKATNPFCTLARPIYYDIDGYAHEDGTFTLSGVFRQVPDHEFYYNDNLVTSWRTIYRSYIDSREFECFDPLNNDPCLVHDAWISGVAQTYY